MHSYKHGRSFLLSDFSVFFFKNNYIIICIFIVTYMYLCVYTWVTMKTRKGHQILRSWSYRYWKLNLAPLEDLYMLLKEPFLQP